MVGRGAVEERGCCEKAHVCIYNIFLEDHMVPNFAHTAPNVGDKAKCKKLNLVAEKVWSSHTLKTEGKFPQVLLRKEANTRFRVKQTNTCSFFLFFVSLL